MYECAAEDNFSRFLVYGISLEDVSQHKKLDSLEDLSEQEKLELASGNRSGLGHIQLDDYPEHLLEDQITITVTDREGRESTQTIFVKINNNELHQTVLTARIG